MEDPVRVWVPSISPSGLAFYTGDRFPGWKGSLFTGALSNNALFRIELDGERYVTEERLIVDLHSGHPRRPARPRRPDLSPDPQQSGRPLPPRTRLSLMLILASASPSRAASSLPMPDSISPHRAVGRRRGRDRLSLHRRARWRPGRRYETLAELKACHTLKRRPQALVIGCDSTLACEGRLFDKPPTLAAARRQLLDLSGRTHELCSSVVVARGGARLWHHNERAHLTMRQFDDIFLDAYLARAGEGITGSVGAYHLEGVGAHLFSRIDGDYFTILGLPLLPLLAFLAEHGIGLAASRGTST